MERAVGPQRIDGDAFTYVCPVCRKRFRYGMNFEPLCTGPSESLDEHAPMVMRMVKADRREIAPRLANVLANAPMILPAGFSAR